MPFAAQPRCVSKTCPTFIRDGTPSGFKTTSTGLPSSDWLETPTHVLRFWESKFSQIKPTKRAGGRRYYRPKDMLLIGGIKQLLHIEGHTIKGAKQVLREKGLNYVVGLSKPIISEEYVEPVTLKKADDDVTKTNAKSHNEKYTSLKTQKNNSSNQKIPDQPGLFDFFESENPNNDENLIDKMRDPVLSPSALLSRIDDLNLEQRKNIIPIINDLRTLISSWN